jgi:hypothetical protein
MRPHLNKWLGAVACACHTSYVGKGMKRRNIVQFFSGLKQAPMSKITNIKRAGEVAQVLEYLPSKPTTIKKILKLKL